MIVCVESGEAWFQTPAFGQYESGNCFSCRKIPASARRFKRIRQIISDEGQTVLGCADVPVD